MQTRSFRRPAFWLLGGAALAALGYLGLRATAADPLAGRYEAETPWGDQGSGGTHRVAVDVTRGGLRTYVEYSIHMDPPGRTAGCRAPAERNPAGQLEFACNDGWNDVRGRLHGSGGAAVLQVDALGPGGGGSGAFYGEHPLDRVGGTRTER